MESVNDIIGIQFLTLNDDFIKKIAVSNVQLPDMGQNNYKQDSVTDLSMGTVSDNKPCTTCHQNKDMCQGHSGYIDLGTYVFSPIFTQEILFFLKVICHQCGQLVINTHYNLKKMATTITGKIKKGLLCSFCNSPHPHVYENRKDGRSNLIQELYSFNKDSKEVKKLWAKDLLPIHAKIIFDRITPETLKKLGIHDENLAPKEYLNKLFYVLPNPIRPNAISFSTAKASKHDLNIQINNVLKESRKLGDTTFGLDEQKNAKLIKDLQLAVYSFKKPLPSTNDKQTSSITSYLNGKTGYPRGIVLGARILRIIRHYITGNPNMRLNEVLVPLELAMNIQVEVQVFAHNKDYLMKYVANGNNTYPRCVAVYKQKNNSRYTTRIKKDIILEAGDKIYRDLEEGDVLAFCRQPSLMKSNITGLSVKIEPKGKTLSFNPNITTLFAADFDGDEMNAYLSPNNIVAYELQKMAGCQEVIISNGYGSPIIGQIQDGNLGLSLLTRDNVRLNLKNTCRLFDNIDLYPNFEEYTFPISGRDILTELFKICGVKINYSAKAIYYKPGLNTYRKYSKTEINVEIKDGVFLSGIIDKKAVGSKSYNGLYHRIYNKYGAQITMDMCWYMQQIAINYLYLCGYTMHLDDFNLGQAQIENIEKTELSIIAESIIHAENLHKGNIIPPPGKTTEEFYEQEQLKILVPSDSYNEYVHKGLDYENNHLYFAIHSGSKGSVNNLSEGSVACGQITVKNKRLYKKLGGRSSHFFPRDSTDPRARGFIANSYFKGLTPVDLVNSCYSARIGLIDKPLSTADSGSKYREAVSSLNSLILNHFRNVIKGNKLRQTLYGGDGMDTRATCKAVSGIIKLTNEQIQKITTSSKSKDLETKTKDLETKSSSKTSVLENEYNTLIKARDFIRKVAINMEQRLMEPAGTYGFIPVNVQMILTDIKVAQEKVKITTTTNNNYDIVVAFIKNIPRLYVNKNYKGTLPDYLNDSCKLFQSYLYYELRSEVVNKFETKYIEILIKLIENSFINNLEDPGACVGIRASQAISEPNTQRMLDSIHGKASNDILNFKNIMSAVAINKFKNAGMEIYLDESVVNTSSKEEVMLFAKKIEMLKFKYFINLYQIFYENFGQSIHPKYKHENAFVTERAKSITPPNDLTSWCVRLEFNIARMISQNITVEEIYLQIIKQFSYVYVVHETLNSQNVVMRIYLRQEAIYKYKLTESIEIKAFATDLLDLTVRGIYGIAAVDVISKEVHYVNDKTELVSKSIYYIVTEGSNLAEILLLPEVDGTKTKSNVVKEMYELYGITAARNLVLDGLLESVKGAYYSHYTVFADEMCATTEFTGLNRNGSAARGTSICQLIADSSYMRFLKMAAKKGTVDLNNGPNSATIMGTTAKVGTNYNEIGINEEFIEKFIQEQESVLEDI